jgi:hypothetical protein
LRLDLVRGSGGVGSALLHVRLCGIERRLKSRPVLMALPAAGRLGAAVDRQLGCVVRFMEGVEQLHAQLLAEGIQLGRPVQRDDADLSSVSYSTSSPTASLAS